MIELIISIAVCFLVGLLLMFFAKAINYSILDFAILIFVFCGVLLVNIIDYYGNPKAIDVYRGRTTLQLTYQDSIPIDTVVVFKNKKKSNVYNTLFHTKEYSRTSK